MLLPVVFALALPAQLDVELVQPDAHADAEPDASTTQPPVEHHASTPAPAGDCAALFGDAERVDERRARREDRLESVARSENLLDIVHSDAGWQAPKPMRVPGLDVLSIEDGPEGERVARVRVGEAWKERCAPGEYTLGVDDGLGSEGLVLAVVDEGVLAEHKGDLIFVPRLGVGAPPFRMIWRSTFALNLNPGSNAGIGGSSSGSSPRRNSRATAGRDSSSKQRARAEAKAAAESRRTLSTRQSRPRG